MKHSFSKYNLFLLVTLIGFISASGQKHISLRDSLDSQFDLSDYLIDANGFVPVPYIITEPALGGFGGALFPVFINKRPPYRDSVRGKLRITPVAPDITGGGALYTANKTWGTFAFRRGTFIKSRIKYLAGGGYIHLNMSFYKTFESIGEKEFKITIDAVPAIVQAIKRLGVSHWYAGFKYVFLGTKLSFNDDSLTRVFVDSTDSKKRISQLGFIVEMDNRDNIFTPDRGMKIHFDAIRSDDAIASDYDFWRLNYYAYGYQPLFKPLIVGLRVDGKQTFGDVPFYMLPFIEMRGVPAVRYQGKASLLSEMETRYDVRPRWSLMLYGGAGKAFDSWNEFDDANWVLSYGTGFRYLLARKFKLRVGIDVAHGPDTWAYYIVFGSSWLK
jgi:hypothetical protein